MPKGRCGVWNCKEKASWRCVDADALYCDKHKNKLGQHGKDDRTRKFHIWEKYTPKSFVPKSIAPATKVAIGRCSCFGCNQQAVMIDSNGYPVCRAHEGKVR